MPPLVIVGIDGAPLDYVTQLVGAGQTFRLPTFKGLLESGVSAPLRSTVHPNTPLAWTSMFTGVNGGKHGVFDFRYFDLARRAFSFTSALDCGAPMFWELPHAAGLKTIAVNIPLSYPPQPINGIAISGMTTPDLASMSYPQEVAAGLLQKFPDYQIDCIWRPDDSLADFPERVLRIMHARANAALHLLDAEAPDVCIIVFTETDRLQHLYWNRRFEEGNPVAAAYEAIDVFLARLMDRLERMPGSRLFIASDHGFQEQRADFFPCALLRSLNMLKLEEDPHNIALDTKARRGFEFIDWERTVAYAYGHFGSLFMNRSLIASAILREEELYSLRDEIHSVLKSYDNGLFTKIHYGDDLFSGPFRHRMPDLLLEADHYRIPARDGAEFLIPEIVAPPVLPYTGTHAMDGLFLAYGQGIGGSLLSQPHIYDVAPTLLQALGLGIPDTYDGRCLSELFLGEENNFPPRIAIPDSEFYRKRGGAAVDPEQAREQLWSLGYLA